MIKRAAEVMIESMEVTLLQGIDHFFKYEQVLVVKLFDLCYSEYAWDSLSKWFIGQFYFTKTIATMQKKQRQIRCFFGR